MADCLAEAFAERLQRQARLDWGYGAAEADARQLIEEAYRGSAPPRLTARPDHTESGCSICWRPAHGHPAGGKLRHVACQLGQRTPIITGRARYFAVGPIDGIRRRTMPPGRG